jgi:cell division protease FtsH
VTIIPRGRALGVTMFLPEDDRYSLSRQAILSQICSLYGGRIAEEMTLGKEGVTTGASNDIQRATQLARNMVTKWGLSEKLGPLLYEAEDSDPFSGMPGQGAKGFSDDTTQAIDQEVKEIIDNCYAQANQILHDNRDILDAMAEALMKYETIDSGQLDQLLAREEVSPPEDWDENDSGNTNSGNDSQDADEEVVTQSEQDLGDSDVPEAPEKPSQS